VIAVHGVDIKGATFVARWRSTEGIASVAGVLASGLLKRAIDHSRNCFVSILVLGTHCVVMMIGGRVPESGVPLRQAR
jgi:hypothetical protein